MSSRFHARRFHKIARLGNIPGLTSKSIKDLLKKKKEYFKIKKSKQKKPNLNQTRILNIDFDLLQKKYKKFFAFYKLCYIPLKKEKQKELKNTFLSKYEKFDHMMKGYSSFTLLKNFSKYSYNFREKQIAKNHYGLKDYQLRTFARKYIHRKSNKIDSLGLTRNFNARLDTVVFFFNKCMTMKAARQLINHKKIMVNGKIISKPSFICKEKDQIFYKGNNEIVKKKEIFFSWKNMENMDIYSEKMISMNSAALIHYYTKKR